MHDEEKIIRRMTRLLQKEIFEELSTEEREELEDWLKTDVTHRVWYESESSALFRNH